MSSPCSLKTGKKRAKVPTLKFAVGATNAKTKISKSLVKKVKAGAKKRQKSVLTGPLGT